MSLPAHDFDSDEPDAADGDLGEDEELSYERLLWQLLLLINPGDEDAAREQFHAWQEMQPDGVQDEADALAALRQVIDWKAGFLVEADDAAGFIECVDELAARFGLQLDWNEADEAPEENDVASLIGRAHDQLREHGYTLWTWSVHGAPREDLFAGWITLRSEAEALEIVAPSLGIDLRPGSAF